MRTQAWMEARFWSHVRKTSGCWVWTGPKTNGGYGCYGKKMAHRFSWVKANKRAIPDGLVVMHDCDRKDCVNPNHLMVGTRRENQLQAMARGLLGTGVGRLASGRWRARFMIRRREVYVGNFATRREALAARDTAVTAYVKSQGVRI